MIIIIVDPSEGTHGSQRISDTAGYRTLINTGTGYRFIRIPTQDRGSEESDPQQIL